VFESHGVIAPRTARVGLRIAAGAAADIGNIMTLALSSILHRNEIPVLASIAIYICLHAEFQLFLFSAHYANKTKALFKTQRPHFLLLLTAFETQKYDGLLARTVCFN
jgi:hypothetical protein